MVGKEEQGSGVRDTQTWVSRTKRTLRRRGYFPSLESSPPAGGTSPKKRNRGFAAAAASFFLSDQKETKESPGAWLDGKSSACGLGLSLATPPDPLVYGSVEGVPRHLRPARCPLEWSLFERRPKAAPKP